MSRLSQLNKADAHKALAALTQRQQSAATQFDGAEAFATILSAQSSQSDAIDGNNTPKQKQRDAQDDAPQAQAEQPARLAQNTVAADIHATHADQRHVDAKRDDTHATAVKKDEPAQADAAPAAAKPHDGKKADAKKTDAADKDDDKKDAQADTTPTIVADATPAIVAPVEAKPAVADAKPLVIDAAPAAVDANNEAPQIAAPPTVGTDLPPAVAIPVAADVQPQNLPLHMMLAMAGTMTAAPQATAGADQKAPAGIALNDVQLPAKFQPLTDNAPGTVNAKPALPAISVPEPQAPAPVAAQVAALPADLLASAKLPATPADVTKAATAVLQQLAPIANAVAQPTVPQGVKIAAPQLQAQTLNKVAATDTQPQVTLQPAVDATYTANATVTTAPQPVTVNPLLAGNDISPSAINPVLNATPNLANPALQTAAQAAVAAPAANGFAAAADTQLAESQLGVESFDMNVGAHTLARYDAGSMARAGKLSNTAAGAALPANVQVAVQLARAAKSGDKSFNLQLHPAELGRVEVKLEVDSKGGATARILVDSQATLDLLQTHRAGLERALTDAGLKCDTGGISFDLRDSGQSNQGAQQQAGRNTTKNNTPGALSGTADATVDPSIIANLTLSLQPGRIDIKA